MNAGKRRPSACSQYGTCDTELALMATDATCSCLTGAVSTASGSALIRLGDTTIVCGIKAETAEPDWDRPNEGWLGSCSRISPADISCPGSDEIRLCCSTECRPSRHLFSQLQAWSTSRRSSGVLATDSRSAHFVSPDLPSIHISTNPPADILRLFRTNVLPLRKLGIRAGKSAWVLYIDIVCINYDGNAFDAAVLAVMTALRNSQS